MQIEVLAKEVEHLKGQFKSDKATREGISQLIDLKIENNNELKDTQLDLRFEKLNTHLHAMENRLVATINKSLESALTRSEQNLHNKWQDKIDKGYKVASFLSSIWVAIGGICLLAATAAAVAL